MKQHGLILKLIEIGIKLMKKTAEELAMVGLKIELPEDFLEEELRCGYWVTTEMKKVWAVELDLLNELQRVCKKHEIQ